VGSNDRLVPWSGTGSWVTGHTGQLNDGSRRSGGHKMWPIVSSAGEFAADTEFCAFYALCWESL